MTAHPTRPAGPATALAHGMTVAMDRFGARLREAMPVVMRALRTALARMRNSLAPAGSPLPREHARAVLTLGNALVDARRTYRTALADARRDLYREWQLIGAPTMAGALALTDEQALREAAAWLDLGRRFLLDITRAEAATAAAAILTARAERTRA